jgi:hypothetical protein
MLGGLFQKVALTCSYKKKKKKSEQIMETRESWKQLVNTLEQPKANPHFSLQESISQSNEPCTSWNQKKGCLHKKSKTSSR